MVSRFYRLYYFKSLFSKSDGEGGRGQNFFKSWKLIRQNIKLKKNIIGEIYKDTLKNASCEQKFNMQSFPSDNLHQLYMCKSSEREGCVLKFVLMKRTLEDDLRSLSYLVYAYSLLVITVETITKQLSTMLHANVFTSLPTRVA